MCSAYPRPQALLLSVVALCALGAACEREQRDLRQLPAAGARTTGVPVTSLQPGVPEPPPFVKSPYQDNAYHVAEGKRFFSAFNCTGCHAHGGGGMGPPLMDGAWLYGSDPRQIFSTIAEGRPNGMPAFGGRIPDQQIWQLVAYVQSLSGQLPKDVAPARSDHMSARKPPAQTPEAPRRWSGSRQP